MKKFISILIFSLLLNSNVYADLYKFFELKEDPKIIIDEIDFDTFLIKELNDLEFYLGKLVRWYSPSLLRRLNRFFQRFP